MGGVAQRFVFINVDRGHPWVSGIERYHWRANERRAAVTMPRVGSTSRMCKVSKSCDLGVLECGKIRRVGADRNEALLDQAIDHLGRLHGLSNFAVEDIDGMVRHASRTP